MDEDGQEIKDEDEVNWEQLEQGAVQDTVRQGIGWKKLPIGVLGNFSELGMNESHWETTDDR